MRNICRIHPRIVVPACQVSSKDGLGRRYFGRLCARFGQDTYKATPPYHGEGGHIYHPSFAGFDIPSWFAYFSFFVLFEGLTPRSFCGWTSSSRSSTRPCSSTSHRWPCNCPPSPLCSTFACCQADYLCDVGIVFGLLDVARCGVLCPPKRNVFGASLAKARRPLAGNQLSLKISSLYQGVFFLPCPIAATAFIFSSSWTIPLYASLRGSTPPTATKRRRRFSFRTLIVASVAIAVVLVLPLFVFASSSSKPVSSPLSRLSPKFTDLKCRTHQSKE